MKTWFLVLMFVTATADGDQETHAKVVSFENKDLCMVALGSMAETLQKDQTVLKGTAVCTQDLTVDGTKK